jgi:hypothetical protein
MRQYIRYGYSHACRALPLSRAGIAHAYDRPHHADQHGLVLGIADGRVLADDTCVYVAREMRVGLVTPAI